MTSAVESTDLGPAGMAIGVVGLGAMGLRLATGLVDAGAQVTAVDPSPEAATRAGEAGVTVVPAAADLAGCEVVVLSLPTPRLVLDVVTQLADAAAAAGAHLTVLDTSTVGPADARAAAEVAAARGQVYADTPILGRPESVGRWTFPVGGSAETVALAQRVLAPVAGLVEGVGDVGAASATKVLNNLMLGTINAVTAELLVLADAAGLDPGRWVDLVVGSGAASVSPLFRDVAARAVDGDFEPTFTVQLMHKDNSLALDLADQLRVPMITGTAAQHLNTMALSAGHGAEDSIAVVKVLQTITGRDVRRHAHRTT
ncbi:NAD(P)-dependent oxidoreductase [Nocardioides nanhaiensis]|uniref:NAD(P)-dependent oxidoreductase n=1 Tax=Nocardioides nanhaiensis TaxID=1476871 RepID=A0ABP8VWJ6_9ACTN